MNCEKEMEKCTCQTFCVPKETELNKKDTQSRSYMCVRNIDIIMFNNI